MDSNLLQNPNMKQCKIPLQPFYYQNRHIIDHIRDLIRITIEYLHYTHHKRNFHHSYLICYFVLFGFLIDLKNDHQGQEGRGCLGFDC